MMIVAIDQIVSIATLRSLSTVLAFVAFIAICLWAYSRERRDDFEKAANLPFADDYIHRSINPDFSREMKPLSEEKNS